jgi:hypothetical protein
VKIIVFDEGNTHVLNFGNDMEMNQKYHSNKLKLRTINSILQWLCSYRTMVLLSNNSTISFGLITTLYISLVVIVVIELSTHEIFLMFLKKILHDFNFEVN